LKIKVLAFGVFTDIFNDSSVELNVSLPLTVREFRNFICCNYPQTKKINFAIAVNESYANEGTLINEGDIIALIPPVSGG